MIKILNLSKSFGSKQVLNNLSLTIEEGKVLGLVGINGAGKSTLLRLMAGVYQADKGEILYDEENVYENEKVKQQIFFLPDEPFYNSNTTPTTLSSIYEVFYEFNKEEYLNYLKESDMPLNKTLNTFSKGMKRQVFIALALALKPKYLFLDEAFDGLDPLARLKFKKAIINLVEDHKTTIVISSHSLRELEDICDSYALLDNAYIASTGEITDATSKYHKYQLAFNDITTIEQLKEEFISYQREGRIVKVVTKESYDEFIEKMKPLSPILVDEIVIDFEEMFIIEVENRGYLK